MEITDGPKFPKPIGDIDEDKIPDSFFNGEVNGNVMDERIKIIRAAVYSCHDAYDREKGVEAVDSIESTLASQSEQIKTLTHERDVARRAISLFTKYPQDEICYQIKCPRGSCETCLENYALAMADAELAAEVSQDTGEING